MSGYLPPGFPYPIFPPPPPPSPWSPPKSRDNSTTSGGVIAGVAMSVGAFLLLLSCLCSLHQGYRNSRANAAADDAAAAAAALAARPQAPPPRPEPWDNQEQWLRRHRSDRDDDGRTRRASLTAGLPSFTYNRTVRHNVTGSGDEAATCSVCLGAFQVGETVRLLPVCMHLYHVECIDPWLEAHATCPLCRSGTEESTMHGRLLLPV
ncbi:putative RING-H2 finger protein ATL71 [Zea mays]|jgi:hypothetical protein|uniref:RING-type E3 ubiquitin transferase n=1 Tax=Zea mays TaxID=4577 RepID=K7VDL6_MAIZE|nr:putative RING-H2 finger protein ATL71 [Zea mays]AQL03770.1 Putative RING zinc finger domain superfamily protein [Zea mays]|eukprot:XP_008660883.1 putative RING-H2 finger protein ATL71 [Zea mays]